MSRFFVCAFKNVQNNRFYQKKKKKNLKVVTQTSFHIAASNYVHINVKNITVTHSMDRVDMDVLIQTLARLTALVIFSLQITILNA